MPSGTCFNSFQVETLPLRVDGTTPVGQTVSIVFPFDAWIKGTGDGSELVT